MKARFRHGVMLVACMALAACAQPPISYQPQPEPWAYGYTILEDPAVLSSQISNCLHMKLDPKRLDEMKGVVRFSTTTEMLRSNPAVDAFFEKERRRIVYRERPAGNVPEDVVVHEVMHWVFETGRMPAMDSFADDAARFFQEYKDHRVVKYINAAWEGSLRQRGESYASQRENEYYAYIGGVLSLRCFKDDKVPVPSVVPEYLWQHYRGVLAPSMRRWRPADANEVEVDIDRIELARVGSAGAVKVGVGFDQLDSIDRYGAVVDPAASHIDRLEPSIAVVTSLATGQVYVGAQLPIESFELRVRLPRAESGEWQKLTLAQRREQKFLVTNAQGQSVFIFTGEQLAYSEVDVDGVTVWLALPLAGNPLVTLRHLFDAYYDGALSVVCPSPSPAPTSR